MNGETTQLACSTACGATLSILGSVAFVGPKRTFDFARRLGLLSLFLALFVGMAVQTLALSLVETRPYTLAFLSTNDLQVQALMEDPDLRTRYNVDSRLRYIPAYAAEQVINLESPYRLDAGPFRTVAFPEVFHTSSVTFPAGVSALRFEGNGEDLRKEVSGLFESAEFTIGGLSSARADLARDASVGFLLLGLVTLFGGFLPLVIKLASLISDGFRLLRATSQRTYRGARLRSLRSGLAGLTSHHFGKAKPFANLASFGLIVTLAGLLLGLAREDETRRLAQAVFRQARHLRIDGRK